MRIRAFVAMAAAVATVVPMAARAGNPEDCASQVEMRSGGAILSPSSTLNCDTLNAPELTYSPVYPGGGADILFTGNEPIDGNRLSGFGSYLTYNQTSATGATTPITIWLSFEPAEAIAGPLEGRWNSQDLGFGARDSVVAGDIYVRVLEPLPFPDFADECTTEEPIVCYLIHERTFTTASGWVDGV